MRPAPTAMARVADGSTDSSCRTILRVFLNVFYIFLLIALLHYDKLDTLAEEEPVGGGDYDYPLLAEIPNTGFECVGRIPGYYADDHPTALCQVFHYCHHDGRIFDFLCPNTTIFNQKVFACDHFYNFECETAKEYYFLNDVFLNGSSSSSDN